MRSSGADEVVDYERRDVTRPNGAVYDLVFDVASTLSISRCKGVLAPTGKYVMIGHDHYGAAGTGRIFGGVPKALGAVARAPFSKHAPDIDFKLPSKKPAMAVLQNLLEAGRLTPIIDRTFPLEEASAALQYLQEGRARGRILVIP